MLFEEFEHIRGRHGMYGIHKIEDLELFMTGLKAAARIYTFSMRADKDFLVFIDFKVWLKDEFYKVRYGKTWVELIREDSKNDRDTLDKFFELLDKYRALRKQNRVKTK